MYEKHRVIQQLETIKHNFSGYPIDIHYAIKANSNVELLKLINAHGGSVETVSIEELELVKSVGFENQQILYTPNGVAMEELEAAFQHDVLVHLDNLEQLRLIKDKQIGIRINPDLIDGENAKVSVGSEDSKFGLPVCYLDEALAIIKRNNITLIGLHIHVGSGLKDQKTFDRSADILFRLANEFPTVEYIDFGGGFKVKYHIEDKATDMNWWADSIKSRINQFKRESGRSIRIKCEPGKYIVAESGNFICKVSLVKKVPHKEFVFLNSGFNQLPRPMYYGAYHEIINISNPDGKLKPYDVVGYCCETDTFATERMLPEVSMGDYLVFKNAGAYCYSMASHYNLRTLPKEILI